ncbi:hypothetical protein DESUT3_01840 [Desulfuromonas versatilis]|uniref:Uncharacterized protein n=1 Tax=Desulfuromonas versatilis TaxID=2802975 RepID=A0ABM8HRM4_9BACT|nr:hypothetical protein [Desulfuromonas versatilis]BCR03115.1 hypothetical protein DESUT3_01840 [Desulfuromonas versatilis]
MARETAFKTCPFCFTGWTTVEDFLKESNLSLNGYKADFERIEYGLFLFTHQSPGCHSTLAIEAGDFFHLYTKDKYPEKKTNSETCPKFCLDETNLNRCEAFCECAFVREIIQTIMERQAAGSES